MINAAHHWKIVFSAMRVAVESRSTYLAEAVGRMVAARDGAEQYETARAHVEATRWRVMGYEQDLDGRWVRRPSAPTPPTKRGGKAGGQ